VRSGACAILVRFVCDGSSLVTSGRGQPTMTIQALAFRAGDHIARFAKRGEI
jgi:choline dehydrogenase-like flavoprotein